MTSEELIKTSNLQKIVTEGASIYEKIKAVYDVPANKGKFLAIEIESKKEYMADTSADAVVAARKNHPDKVFYVMKIGYNSAETFESLYVFQMPAKVGV